jgi:mono/diheme cytochrome c family protein
MQVVMRDANADVAGAVAAGAVRRFDPVAKRTSSPTPWTLRFVLATSALWLLLVLLWPWEVQAADQEQVERGRYLVTLGGCTDCHTPGHFLGKPDMARQLGGSDVGFEVPGLGVFYGPNLTPDNETGLGNWSVADIIKAIRTGVRPDGRGLVPIMPWQAYAKLTQSDAEAIAAYLKSLPAVRNQVPGPFGPGQTPTSFVMRIVPPAKP